MENNYTINVEELEPKHLEGRRNLTMYSTTIIPRVGEELYFPHMGTFAVHKVTYHISDDIPKKENNKVMFVTVEVVKYR